MVIASALLVSTTAVHPSAAFSQRETKVPVSSVTSSSTGDDVLAGRTRLPAAAKWIGRDNPAEAPSAGEQTPAPLLRKTFTVTGDAQRAKLTVVGLGYYVAYVNGRRVGNGRLDPAPSQYDRIVFSRSFNVAKMLRPGKNVVAVELGRSYLGHPAFENDIFGLSSATWWSEPRLKAALSVRDRTGAKAVVTDRSWRIADGPRMDALYLGEDYDARRARRGWTTRGFDDTGWSRAEVQTSPTERVVPAKYPPVRIQQTLAPKRVLRAADGTRVYDFGRVTAGWARIAVRAPRGTRVGLDYGEQLGENGLPYHSGATSPPELNHRDSYTTAGSSLETWEPEFTRHGFRYVAVRFTGGDPKEFRIRARVAHSDLAHTGRLKVGNPILQKVHDNQVRSLLDNLWGLPTDTPWRDRQGWTADVRAFFDSAALNLNVKGLIKHWLLSYGLSQLQDGTLPVVVPNSESSQLSFANNDPSWSGSLLYLAWDHYREYGDASVLRSAYPVAKRWLDLMNEKISTTGNLYAGFSFGDWVSPGSEANNNTFATPPEGFVFSANADLYKEARLAAGMARFLGRAADATELDSMAQRILTGVNAAFFDPVRRVYFGPQSPAIYRQTPNVLALAFDMVPPQHEGAVVENLVADIKSKGDHLDTGVLGTKYILPVLTEHGHADLAWKIASQTTYPSWGYWVEQGAATSWEFWETTGPDQSLNHAFLGSVDEWMYKYLAGIQPTAPGYRRVTVAPYFAPGLPSTAARVATPRGPLSSAWRRTSARTVRLDIVVPRRTPALVIISAPKRDIEAPESATLIESSAGRTVYSVTAGTRSFVVKTGG